MSFDDAVVGLLVELEHRPASSALNPRRVAGGELRADESRDERRHRCRFGEQEADVRDPESLATLLQRFDALLKVP